MSDTYCFVVYLVLFTNLAQMVVVFCGVFQQFRQLALQV
jgi:hypothetical protein